MMILINAFKSLSRSRGRNILIGIIVLTIAVSSSIALAVKSAAETAKETGLANQTITGAIWLDRGKLMDEVSNGNTGQQIDLMEFMSQYAEPSITELQTYAQSEYVQDTYYTADTSLNASGDLKAYGSSSDSSSSSSSSAPAVANDFATPNGSSGFSGRSGGASTVTGDFQLSGFSSESDMTKFTSGESKITAGQMFDVGSADLNCLISNELALQNGLAVGDTITLSNPSAATETYTFTIVGIYTSSSSNNRGFAPGLDLANQIMTSYAALETAASKSKSVATTATGEDGAETSTALELQVSATYVFADLASYDGFSEYISANAEYYAITSSDVNNYKSSLVPLENLSSFATTLLFIVLGVGTVILIVLNIFNIRERKYEVGVLTAIGIKKPKVALQYVTELLAVTLVAVIIGTGIGATASVPVSNSLLAAQVEAQETQQASQQQNFGRSGVAPGGPSGGAGGPISIESGMFGNANNPVEYLDTINATIGFDILGQLVGIGLLLTILSSLAGVVFVLRYEPLKILAERA